ncbi:MAG: homocysteine S-methyltransferase family protein [Verrucomicrobiae bacterium]|nr:homocysteine S-methyltransferase family protein [Verrucomicrobiae bacterium]
MHPTFDALLSARLPVVTDGGWGTEFQKLGLAPGECPDRWNLEHPDRVKKVARAYVDAGSRVILTNTFGANRVVLERQDLAGKLAEINRVGAALSREAAGDRALVLASIGPTCKMVSTGEIEAAELQEIFAEQAAALVEGGAQGFVLETFAEVEEACCALAAAKATGLPCVVSMVFDSGKAKDRTMMGTTPEQAAAQLDASGADALGANCGQGIEGYISICARLRAATARPIWIKANAGLPEMIEGKAVYRATPAEFAAHALKVKAAGASFLGGCCGTSPAFIEALAKAW